MGLVIILPTPYPQEGGRMQRFDVEISGPDAGNDARALQDALAQVAQTRVAGPPASKGLDAVTVIAVSAAVLPSGDILYRFYRDSRQRQRPAPLSYPAMTLILADGTRIELAEIDPEAVKALLAG